METEKSLFNSTWTTRNVSDFTLFDFDGDGVKDIIIMRFDNFFQYKSLIIYDYSFNIIFQKDLDTNSVNMELRDFDGESEDELLVQMIDSIHNDPKLLLLEDGDIKEYTLQEGEALPNEIMNEDFYIVTMKSPEDITSEKYKYSGIIKVLDSKGELLWQKDLDFDIIDVRGTDLDNDGKKEIIVRGYWIVKPRVVNGIFVYSREGEEEWYYNWWGGSGLETADINKDGKQEVIFGAGNPYDGGKVVCLDYKGNVIWENEIKSAVRKISVSRIEDRGVILLLTDDYGSALYIFDLDGKLIFKKELPQKRWGENNEYIESDYFNAIRDFLVIDMDDDGNNEILFSQHYFKILDLEGNEKIVSNKFCLCEEMMSEDFDRDGDIDIVSISGYLYIFSNSKHFGKLDIVWLKNYFLRMLFKAMILSFLAFFIFLPIIEFKLFKLRFGDYKYLAFLSCLGISCLIFGFGNITYYFIYDFTFDSFSYRWYGMKHVLEIIGDIFFYILISGFGFFILLMSLVAYLLKRYDIDP